MIRLIRNMPPGTIGIEAVGKVTEDDYQNVLVPAVSEALERNDVRLMYILGDDFESYSPGALWAAGSRARSGEGSTEGGGIRGPVPVRCPAGRGSC